MSYSIRPAEDADVPQMTEIDREAFPSPWPSSAFKRDLHRSVVSFLVAYAPSLDAQVPSSIQGEWGAARGDPPPQDRRGLWRRLGGLFQQEVEESPRTDYIAGYVSIVFMADDAHITSIAVREPLRGNGVGELLVLASIELAMKRRCRLVTLEVRVSNHVAQSLYTKYGFKQVGTRRRYYIDPQEDAYIMTTDPISSPAYGESFRRLVEAYKARRGEVALVLK